MAKIYEGCSTGQVRGESRSSVHRWMLVRPFWLTSSLGCSCRPTHVHPPIPPPMGGCQGTHPLPPPSVMMPGGAPYYALHPIAADHKDAITAQLEKDLAFTGMAPDTYSFGKGPLPPPPARHRMGDGRGAMEVEFRHLVFCGCFSLYPFRIPDCICNSFVPRGGGRVRSHTPCVRRRFNCAHEFSKWSAVGCFPPSI